MAINAFNHSEWREAGFKDFGDFAECVEYVNQSECGDGQLEGRWWYADDAEFVVYYGSFGNYNSPGADCYTYAERYETEEKFSAEVNRWESFPEYLPDDETDIEDWNDLDDVTDEA